jgi:UDP-2-acetamido-2,6-beta-L-arabino-hexul-4-ose reductase
LADDFNRCLYATYLSHLGGSNFAYNLQIQADDRGCLAEFMKSQHFGQLFVSRTRPGITRGNHYHHTKTEKFMVVQGEGVIRFRPVMPQQVALNTEGPGHKTEITEHRVSGKDFRVVDIPPGYTHSIENVGNTDMVVLFWASEIFDPARPDTIALPVLQ